MSHPVIFLVALLGSCHYSTAELCTKSRANPCTIDQMRNNLLCRLTGGTTLDVTSLSDADKTNAVRSYLKYILEMVPNTVEIAAKRIEAMDTIFLALSNLEQANFAKLNNDNQKIFTLEKAEKAVAGFLKELIPSISTGRSDPANPLAFAAETCIVAGTTGAAFPCGSIGGQTLAKPAGANPATDPAVPSVPYEPTCAIN